MRRAGIIFASFLLAAPTAYGPTVDADAALAATEDLAGAAEVRRQPIAFIASLSGRIVHGERHDGLAGPALLAELGGGDLSLTCGPAVDFVRSELRRRGVRARNIALAAPPPYNGYDDGHIMLEVETPDGPILVDVAQKRLFLVGGKPASYAAVRARGFGAVELSSFAPARVDPAFRYARLRRAILADPRPWYGRMFAGAT
jgi:hypothetical protein